MVLFNFYDTKGYLYFSEHTNDVSEAWTALKMKLDYILIFQLSIFNIFIYYLSTF